MDLNNSQKIISDKNCAMLLRHFCFNYAPNLTTLEELEELEAYDYIQWYQYEKEFSIREFFEDLKCILEEFRYHRGKSKY
jgi:hypothetical protein